VCDVGMMCGVDIGYEWMCYGAGVVWCGAGNRKRVKGKREEGKKGRHNILHKKNGGRVIIYMNFLAMELFLYNFVEL